MFFAAWGLELHLHWNTSLCLPLVFLTLTLGKFAGWLFCIMPLKLGLLEVSSAWTQIVHVGKEQAGKWSKQTFPDLSSGGAWLWFAPLSTLSPCSPVFTMGRFLKAQGDWLAMNRQNKEGLGCILSGSPPPCMVQICTLPWNCYQRWDKVVWREGHIGCVFRRK